MACTRSSLTDYLANFTGQDPINAVVCPYAQDGGAAMGVPVFALFFFGFLGLGLSIKAQHPGPVIVAGMLTVAAIAASIPGQAAKIVALVIFFALAGAGLFVYQRAKTSL